MMVARAERWTAGQAERLGTTPEVILDAVLRGWMPPEIEKAETRYHLEGAPASAEAKKIREAEVRPIKMKPPPPPNWGTPRANRRNLLAREYGPRGATGSTTMEEAFKQAAE